MADNQNQNQTQAPAQTAPAQTVFMLDRNGNPGEIPADKAAAAQAQGYTPATKMVDQNGQLGYVATDKVAAARQHNYAVTPDNPGVTKMLTMNGQTAYVLPNEVDSWEKSKNAVRVNQDGSLYVPPGQSEWSQEYRDRHDTWFQAHQTPAVQNALATSDQLEKKADKGMAIAGIAGSGAVGANALLAPTVATTAGGLGFGGAAASEVAGPSLAAQGLTWLNNLPTWLKLGAVAAGGGPSLKKWLLH